MTAVSVRATPAPARLRGPHGLVWLTLRVHRTALLFWSALVAVFAGALLWAYGPGHDAARTEYVESGCGSGRPNLGCDMGGPAFDRYDYAIGVSGALLAALPLLVAAWAGAALIGRELEHGTAQLAWAQSVSPARWLAAKLAVPAALLAAGTLTLTLLHRLAWTEGEDLYRNWGYRVWHDDTVFVANGTTATAHALLGLALGALAGLVLRRALPALAVGALAALAVINRLGAWRPRLWPTETAFAADDYPETVGMIVEGGAVTSTGARVPIPDCAGEPGCLTARDITGFYADHHPASHFWPLHLVEAGIALALAALAVTAAFVLLRHRTGPPA
ncbi:ABC transporter permease [Streptomyces sp. NPDC000983]|uniref:ABC transporter permease n=1 Tax=Streptomyces sp. NPDC000983 TaxID=3154373 RepID=UPI003330042A